MQLAKLFLSRYQGKPTDESLTNELRPAVPITNAKEYNPTSYYPIDAENMPVAVVATLNDARKRKVEMSNDYIVDEKEQERVHAAMRRWGIVGVRGKMKHANIPPIEQILAQSPEPFQYHFHTGFWFMTINALPVVKTYETTERYRIDAIEMPRELVAVIEASSGRLAAAQKELKGDAADWGVTIPTLPEEQKRIHAAMKEYGLVKKGYLKWHPSIPSLEQIISQNKEEPFYYQFNSYDRLWFIGINPIKDVKQQTT